MVLEAIGYRADMCAGIDLKRIWYSVVVKDAMKLSCVESKSVLVAHVLPTDPEPAHPDEWVVPVPRRDVDPRQQFVDGRVTARRVVRRESIQSQRCAPSERRAGNRETAPRVILRRAERQRSTPIGSLSRQGSFLCVLCVPSVPPFRRETAREKARDFRRSAGQPDNNRCTASATALGASVGVK